MSTCPRCGVEFEQPASNWFPRKYCSRECRYFAKYPPEKRACLHCGKEFLARTHPSHPNNRFCSHSCSTAHRNSRDFATRFWEKVDKSGDCWLFTSTINRDGYGNFMVGGRHGQLIGAHRVAYILEIGPIPPEMVVRHDCDVANCVRPEHLRLGTHADNVADKVARGRWRGNSRATGRFHSTLTAEQVLTIRDRAAHGELHRVMAAEYGVRQSTISRIVARERWKHLP